MVLYLILLYPRYRFTSNRHSSIKGMGISKVGVRFCHRYQLDLILYIYDNLKSSLLFKFNLILWYFILWIKILYMSTDDSLFYCFKRIFVFWGLHGLPRWFWSIALNYQYSMGKRNTCTCIIYTMHVGSTWWMQNFFSGWKACSKPFEQSSDFKRVGWAYLCVQYLVL